MLLRPQRSLFVTRRIFQLCKVLHPSELDASKAWRIVSNSGCLVAGCCFSRQTEEDSLLSTVKKNNVWLDTNITPNDCIHSETITDGDRESNIMKRSSEFTDNVASKDSNICLSTEQTHNKHNKRRKTSDGELENDAVREELSKSLNNDSPCAVSEHTRKENKFAKTQKREPVEKLRPNYFVAVKISDQEIHENLKNIQNHILEKECNLKKSMIELKTLHITLMVMHIGDTDTHARAVKALKSVHQEYDKELSDNPLELEFKGLGHFQNRVLYAKLTADDSYERLCNLAGNVKKHFEANAIFTTDKRSKFTPHLTVAKIDFKKKQNKFIKKIDPELYKDYVDQYFGSQTVESIQLLSMTDPKNAEGYYSGDEIYFSAFDPCNQMNALCEKLEVDRKKEDIKKVISSLMKEKLK